MPWGQNWPRPRGNNFTLNYIRKTSNDFLSWTSNGNLTKLDRNGPWVVPYQNSFVQMVLIGCINMSRVKQKGFLHAIFNNLLVWNYTAQIFCIWHITPSRGPLLKLSKLCPWGHIWPLPRCHNFTLKYTRKTTSSLELLEIWPNLTGMIPGPLPIFLKWFRLVARKNVHIMPLV